MNDLDTLVAMRTFLAEPTPGTMDRVRSVEANDLVETLRGLGLREADLQECAYHWDGFCRDIEWVSLLSSLLDEVERHRGDVDAPIPIWRDLEECGAHGRLLYVYLFALAVEGTREFLEKSATPLRVIEDTLGDLAAHCATHRRKWDTFGVEAGWWMLPVLRGELLQIGSLQFHLVTLGVGALAPDCWYSAEDAAARGPGFRRGDESLGLHIPQDADLSPSSVDETLRDARRVLAQVWPAHERRLATCRSWMLDRRLAQALAPRSNLVRFQGRFTLVSDSLDDDEDVVDFVFRRPGVALEDLPQRTSLERLVVDVLRRGEHWQTATGWFDFDGR